MRIAVLSDIHGNTEALVTVLRALEKERIDRVVCLGDLVGYGPEPEACIDRMLDTTDRIVAGNHDWAAAGRTSTENFNVEAKQAVRWTEKTLSEESSKKLRKLPLTALEEDVLLVHATPDTPDRWRYLHGAEDARSSFEAMHHEFCFSGHSHRPGAFVKRPGGNIEVLPASDFTLDPGSAWIVNPGSVGQPRDGDPRASFGIFDTESRRFQLRRLSYPIPEVQGKMEKQGLPRFLIERLSRGR